MTEMADLEQYQSFGLFCGCALSANVYLLTATFAVVLYGTRFVFSSLGDYSYMGEIRNAYRILMEKPIMRRKVGRYRKSEDNIKRDLMKISYDNVGWHCLRIVFSGGFCYQWLLLPPYMSVNR
jgi:hypothetical protein